MGLDCTLGDARRGRSGAVCGKPVDAARKTCGEPAIANISSNQPSSGVTYRCHVLAPSRRASLDPPRAQRKISRPFLPKHHTVAMHRFEEVIGGRAYAIEVMPVSNRWRAQLVRTPGIPTAMMPFYGVTPDEAAKRLTDWLTLAHRRQAPSTA
jgi:hypothetical protein